MYPATNTLSSKGRIRTVALAATIALGTLLPSLSAVQAQEQEQDTGFDVAVDSAAGLSGLTAVVTGSDDGLNLRAEPSHEADIIGTLDDGTLVDLLIDRLDTVRDPDGTTRWWPVSVDGVEGWVSGFYLTNSTDASATEGDGTTSATPDPAADTLGETSPSSGESFTFTGDSLNGATARVDGAGGSVNMRAEPSTSADLVNTLSDGAIVDLRIDVTDTVVEGDTRWWPISIAGEDGWVSGSFLAANDGSSTTEPTDVSSATTGTSVFAAGDYVQTFTGDGDGVNLRADFNPAGALLEILSEGTVIQIMEGPLGFENSEAGWFKVTTGSVTGYVDGDLLQVASQPGSTSDAATTAAFASGDFALVQTQTQAGARVRSGSNPAAERIGFVPESGIVEIVSGPASFDNSDRGWYEISFEGQTGFVDGDLLFKTDPPVVETPAVEAPATQTSSGSFAAGEVVVTNSQTGVGVNVRLAPGTGSDRVGFLADLSSLEIVEGPQQDTEGDDWYHVSNGAIEGWIAGNLLDRSADAAQQPSNSQSAPRFVAPLDNYIVTQNFGCSNLGYYSYNAGFGCNLHDGIDLAADAGTSLTAAASGTVVFSGWCDCGLGYYVEIDHGDGIHTVYGHMQSQPPVSVGQTVNQGDVIGPVGSTGLSTGPHVHFMVRVNGATEDPRNYLDF